MRIEEELKLDFQDVLIRPKSSTLTSRSDVDISREFVFRHSGRDYRGVPIIAANMHTDEAHRLRNVYKGNKIATAIKQAIAPFPKVLLTATPLQNSLLELYGLASILDDYTFGDLDSFRDRFARPDNDDFAELKQRLQPLCKRTLRRQVLEYVRYTNRHALVQEFVPFPTEQELYEKVSNYLQAERLYALPASQRQLVTLILRKLLASSTYAIASTLEGLVKKLEDAAKSQAEVADLPTELPDNWETTDELLDEWDGGDGKDTPPKKPLTAQELAEMRQEMARLREFVQLARSIPVLSAWC